jgi:DNA-binding transcriptional LysR family regulator
MHGMNLRHIDLNLLVVFDAVMEQRNVTRAAERIALSQSAMSHALRRLRDMLQDELFVRTSEGMIPTPRAEQLAPAISRLLSEVRYTLEPEVFVPAESNHRFTIAINNYAAVVFAAPICAAVVTAAPGVRLTMKPTATYPLAGYLDRDEVDLAIGVTPDSADRFMRRALGEDSFVLLMRAGHPDENRDITPQLLAAIPHLGISSSGESTEFVDRWLAKHGLTREIAVSVPYLSSRHVLEQSNLVATMSRRMAMEFAAQDHLRIREFPFAPPTVTASLVWHRRLNDQPAHRWLRETITSAVKALKSPQAREAPPPRVKASQPS